MDKQLLWLWAKKNRVHDVPMWLPLTVHLQDTMQICGLLYEHWLSDGIKEFLKKTIISNAEDKEASLKNLCMFLGAVHDIGKATPIFQVKAARPNDADLDTLVLDNLKQAGFTKLDEYIANQLKDVRHNISGQYILTKQGVNLCVANIIGAHHGTPVSYQDAKDIYDGYTSSFYQDDNDKSSTATLWQTIHTVLVNNALTHCEYECVSELPYISQPAQVILSGLLIMADWIASNEKYFPLISLDTYNVHPTRVEIGFTKWYNERIHTWQPKSYTSDIYQSRFGSAVIGHERKFIPNDIQEKVAFLVNEIDNPGIMILEAPMGKGKTEVALVAVEELAKKTHRTAMFFGLPTQATSNSMFGRIAAWLQHFDGKQSIRLIHGKAQLNEQFANLPKSRGIFEDNYNNNDNHSNANTEFNENDTTKISVNDWFAGRKLSILDDFTVGTVDQILLMALKQKHLMLRHLGFSNKVVVIDEVHAYDVYMSVYLYRALRWLGAYRVPVVILSATLPRNKRKQLVENYMNGAGKFKTAAKPSDFDTNEAYPLLTYNDGQNIKQFSDFDTEQGINYEIQCKSQSESEREAVVELVVKLTPNGGVVGVIVNTVRRAQEFAQCCMEAFGEDNVALLHSSFIATERYSKEKQLIDTIGKDGKRPHFKIIIGTQVIEQSLDIDFDVLITDLAPMDLLLQRMGRLHRHQITKHPINLQTPKVYILHCSDYNFDKGSAYIYSPFILFRTEYFLKQHLQEKSTINLPNDISPLVQSVYSDTELNLRDEAEKLRDSYRTYKDRYELTEKSKENKAKIYRLGIPARKISTDKNLGDWITNSDKEAEMSDAHASAEVRDTVDTVEVIALKACEGGYEFFDKPGVLDPSDNKTAMEMAKHTIKLPQAILYGIRPQDGINGDTAGIDRVIQKLEDYYRENLAAWDNQLWLKGSLGIIFDNNNEFELIGKTLKYDTRYGLKIVTEHGHE
ncbi:CRISPR-associated helicase Cas3' [Fannyhessea vaginae]|uniref:CRISPR-associated helicase Cas3' n=1 Tax=Fannyhessea vaginae TaxID=82135 RepID=UPI0026E9E17C|nr:CRISPR-associated helicase Cas3' [Fannyhessea vaginae]